VRRREGGDVLGLTWPCKVRSRPPMRSILNLSASLIISASTGGESLVLAHALGIGVSGEVLSTWYGSRNPKLSPYCCMSFLYCFDRLPLILICVLNHQAVEDLCE
jgi:hypothetical protein